MQNKTESKKQELENKLFLEFDTLPDAAQVRIKTVQRLLACSRSTVFRLIKSKVLNPKRFSEKAISFNVGELRKLIANGV